MNHTFSVSEQQYTKLMAYAAQHEQTPETLFQAWVDAVGQLAEKGTNNDPLFQIAGMFAIGDADLAVKHDQYLSEPGKFVTEKERRVNAVK